MCKPPSTMRPPQVQLFDAQALLYGTDRTHSDVFISASIRTCIASPVPPADRRRTGSPHERTLFSCKHLSLRGTWPATSLTFDMSGGAKPKALGRPLDGGVRHYSHRVLPGFGFEGLYFSIRAEIFLPSSSLRACARMRALCCIQPGTSGSAPCFRRSSINSG